MACMELLGSTGEKLYGKEAKISVIHEEVIAPESSGKYRISKALFPLKIEDYLE